MWKVVYFIYPLLCAALVAKREPEASTLGKLPTLGWNSWNAYGCDINEQKFRDAAQKMIDLGLQKAGYQYVNIDDCWASKNRDAGSKKLVSDPAKFPSGLKPLATDIHKQGFKIGIYSSAGYTTCQSFPASLGSEDLDAKEWAFWGIDYLKYDNCGVPNDKKDTCHACVPENGASHHNGTCNPVPGLCAPDYDYLTSNSAARYRAMGEALKNSGRDILYAVCNWGEAGVQLWAHKYASAQSWRSTNDITTSWPRILEIANYHSFNLNNVDFFAHADADMLEIGNGLSLQQTRTHFALWAAMKSPLLIGTDLGKISSAELDVLKNPYLLAFNQDVKVGRPAVPYKWGTNPDWTFNASYPAEYWSGALDVAQYPGFKTLVLVFNPESHTVPKFVEFEEVPQLKGKVGVERKVRNVWTGEVVGCFWTGFTWEVEGYDTVGFLISEGAC